MEKETARIGNTCEKPTAYNDERFRIIKNNARELKGLLHELNEMANHKFNELLGSPPPSPCETGMKDPVEQSWVDEVIKEQDVSLSILRDTLERVAMV